MIPDYLHTVSCTAHCDHPGCDATCEVSGTGATAYHAMREGSRRLEQAGWDLSRPYRQYCPAHPAPDYTGRGMTITQDGAGKVVIR